MRAEIKDNLEREAKRRTQAIVKNQVMDALLKISELDVPKALIEQDQERLVEMARQDLQQRGVPNAADAPIPAEMFTEQAERRVKLGLVLAELVKANELQAKPEQIRAEVDEFAKSYEDPKEVVRWYYSNQQRLAEMEAYVVESQRRRLRARQGQGDGQGSELRGTGKRNGASVSVAATGVRAVGVTARTPFFLH